MPSKPTPRQQMIRTWSYVIDSLQQYRALMVEWDNLQVSRGYKSISPKDVSLSVVLAWACDDAKCYLESRIASSKAINEK